MPTPYTGGMMLQLGGRMRELSASRKAAEAARKSRTYAGQYRQASDRSRDQGRMAEDAYWEEIQGFDPQSYIEDSARGQFEVIRPQIEEYMAQLRGQQVGMGRLDTGFATEGEDRVTTEALRSLDDRLLANSNTAAGMQMGRINSMGQYGMANTDRWAEMSSAGWDRDVAAKNAKAKKKGGIFGTIGSILGGAGGFLLGGPAGAAAGARIGGSVGSGFGG